MGSEEEGESCAKKRYVGSERERTKRGIEIAERNEMKNRQEGGGGSGCMVVAIFT